MYKPANGNSRREIPYRALINQIDPDIERGKHHAPEYVFPNRVFYADPSKRGAYEQVPGVPSPPPINPPPPPPPPPGPDPLQPPPPTTFVKRNPEVGRQAIGVNTIG